LALEPKARLGAYEIVGLLGAGGMGEVYRARDPKLSRDVAIKILPDAFARDPERLARFDREARLLAALNHPNIAGIYGLEDHDDRKYLVLEFVDGESLAQRLFAGPLPVDEALAIARQVVDALEAAHDRGVIHRDLKPANIVLTSDDQVKVLDFGLAKQVDVEARADASQSPTLSFGATRAGVILGTASYMSPEQVKGRPADKRSDVWAFGCVLYEMLTGTRAFDPSTGSRRAASGDDVDNISETLAAILRAEPDLTRLPASVPPTVRAILARCLEKDRKARIPDISVVRFMLENDLRSSATTPSGTMSARSARVWQIATAILAVIVVILAGASVRYLRRPAAPAVSRFFIQPPAGGEFSAAPGRPAPFPRISPDGRRIVFSAADASGNRQLWIRAIDSLTAQPLPGTDGGTWPFWSPDSRQIAYSVGGRLMRIDANGGPPQTICALSGPTILSRGGAWNADGTIVFSRGPGPLFKIASTGGEPIPITKAVALAEAHVFPSFLPDGRHILFYADATGDEKKSGVLVMTLDADDSSHVVDADTGAIYDAVARKLLFVRQGTLLAQSFDPDSLKLSGEPVPVAERVESAAVPGVVAFSLADNGTLAYGVGVGDAAGLQMTWVDRQGKAIGTIAPVGNYRGLDLSPDGKRVAAHRHDGTGGDIWLTDTDRGVTSRFTFDASQENSSPLWSPDGRRIAFGSRRGGKWGLYIKPANQTVDEEKVIDAADTAVILPMSWSPDGSTIVYEVLTRGLGSGDQWQVSLSGDHKAVPLLQTPFQESHGQISPDGRWLAYYSGESGSPEVFVQSYPPGAGKWQISVSGGYFPRWSRDSHELFFINQPTAGKMMAVDVRTNGAMLERGRPKELFTTAYVNLPHGGGASAYHTYAVTPDGQRFLMPFPSANRDPEKRQIAVVLNWAAALPK
jgi:eukaryotic-like serine/threonine-protein kinase